MNNEVNPNVDALNMGVPAEKKTAPVKYLVVGAVILLLLLLGVFALFSASGSNKAIPAGGANSIESVPAASVAPQPNNDGKETAPAVATEEGSIYSDAGVPDEESAQLVYGIDYPNYVYPYEERAYGNDKNWKRSYRILSFVPEKELVVSIGYLDDSGWIEEKQFISHAGYAPKETSKGTLCEYPGRFDDNNDSNYTGGELNFSVLTKPIRLDTRASYKKKNDGELYSVLTDESDIPVILESGK